VVSIGASTFEFESAIKKASQSLKGLQTDVKLLSPAFDAVGRAIKVVGVAIIGAFVAGGVSALASAAKIETYRNSLTTLLGSSQKAGEAVASALALASKTPFTDEQLLAASVSLTKFGQDASKVLPQVANMAAAVGGDVSAAAESYGRFLLGQTKALSAYGINKAMVLKEGAATEQGIQIANEKGQIVNEAAFETALLSLIDKRSKDGAALAANSIAGLKKSLFDVADDALRTMAGVTEEGGIMAGGLADTFKKAVKTIIAQIEEWKANGSLQEWADKVGKAITAFFNGAKIVFEWLVNIAQWIAKYWQAIVPVMAAVVGAFVGFKIVSTYVTLATTAIKLFGSAASIAALGPIALIIGAVATLTAGVVYLIEKLNQQKALLNSMTAAGMAAYDTETLNTGTSMTDAGQDPTAYYASRVAGHQKYVDAIKQQNDDLAKTALASRNATSVAYAKEKQDEYAKTVANNAKTVAQDADLANKIYDLTHTTLQAKLHAIDVQAKADLAAGKNEVQVAEWVRVAKAAANKDAYDASAKLTEAATKKTAEEATKILGVNTDLNDKIYKLSHTTVEDQIYDLAKERDAAIADGGSKLKADQAYTLAAKKVYDDARKEKAAADKDAADKAAAVAKEAADKTLQAQKDAQDKYLASLADYVSKQKDVFSALTSIIIDNYSVQKDTAVSAIEKTRDDTVNALDDMITARQDALSSTLDAISQEKDATLNALNDMISKRQDELSSTLDALDNEKTAVVNAVEKERDATLNALDDMINKRQDELSSTLDAISEEKAAVLGQYDEQIQALQDANAIVQNADTIAGLQSDIVTAQHDIVYAETAADRIAAQKSLNDAKVALDKEMYTESYNAQIASLQKQKQSASDTYDAKKTLAQKTGDAEIQTLRDTVTAAKTSYADQLTSANAYYAAEKTLVQTAGNLQLQQLRDLVTSTQTSYAAMTTAAQTAGNIEIQQLKDVVIAEQKSADARLVFINTFYDQKLATANINADAEKLLATLTSDQIFAMLEAKLPGYAALGAQYGNALYSNVLAAQGAMTALQQTAVQVQPNGKAPAGLSVGTTVATAGGNYSITAVKPDGSYTSVPTTTVAPTLNLGGASGGRALMAHALGGYFTTPHIGLIAEKGPEYVVPQSQAAEFASKMGGSDVAAGLRQLGLKMDTLIFATRQVAPGVGSVINGLGRA